MDDSVKSNWWQRLTGGLKRTSSAVGGAISDLVTKRKLDAATIAEIEDVLIRADLGLETASRIAVALGDGRYEAGISPDAVKAVVAAEIEKALVPVALPLAIDAAKKPFVILVAGVNGSGKTTTIGKLAAKLRAEGRTVMLAAGDTFRAAAIEQLKIWGERTHAPVIARGAGADAAGLVFDAVRCSDRSARRRAAGRYRRPSAKSHRTDGRAGKDRAGDEEGRCRPRRTRCCSCSTPRSGRTRCRRSRFFAKPSASPGW